MKGHVKFILFSTCSKLAEACLHDVPVMNHSQDSDYPGVFVMGLLIRPLRQMLG